MTLKVSIIIRCFNEEKHIGKLLSGISKQTYTNIETIIVDSGSTDDTLQIVKRFPVKIIQINPNEFTFGRALNMGCAEASGDILVFASAHVYPVYDDWIENLIDPFKNQDVGLVYGKQSGNESSKYSEQQVFATWFKNESVLNQKNAFCNNANCAIRRSLWMAQKYDETLTGLEDLDFGKKLFEKKIQISYRADAEIIHVHEETFKQIKNRYRREAIALKKIYPEQSMSILKFLQLFITNLFSDFIHSFNDGVFIKYFYEMIMFRWMQFWGAYLGLNQTSSESTHELHKTFYYPRGIKIFSDSAHQRPKRKKIEYEVNE